MKLAGSRSGSISQRYGSADPDPYQDFMDPRHWLPLPSFSFWYISKLTLQLALTLLSFLFLPFIGS
jgi:hypothetical protein